MYFCHRPNSKYLSQVCVILSYTGYKSAETTSREISFMGYAIVSFALDRRILHAIS